MEKTKEKVPYEFPHIFDTMFDLKSAPEAIRKLEKMRQQSAELKKEYAKLHRLLREHGYKPVLPPEI